ncbi:MAG: hypothetical protein ABI877_16600 [Gemmatimonadaceae bacterium]
MADDESVPAIAGLYLGNILYALERCALSLEAEGQADGAAFYRGIARKLAEARGREKIDAGAGPSAPR